MSVHLPHAALTLALTASSDPPSSLMVTPKYLNEFTCLRLVPWLSLMFTLVPLLLLTITSFFPILTFSPLLSIPICLPSYLLYISSSVSFTTARPSANSSSFGNPHLNFSLMTSNNTINRMFKMFVYLLNNTTYQSRCLLYMFRCSCIETRR